MANIRSIIASLLLIMRSHNAILARIEFMAVMNSILLLVLFIFDTYRRRSRSRLVKYILLAVDAVSSSMLLHTIGMMQSAPLRNHLFAVWGILQVALRRSVNYITVYGLQEQGRFQWNSEFGAALLSSVLAGRLNGTKGTNFIPLWLLWALQPLRVGYMYLSFILACNSYWQGRSSVLLADYMCTQRSDDAASNNNNEVSQRTAQEDNQTTNPQSVIEITEVSQRTTQEDNQTTNPQSVNEVEEVSQRINQQEPNNSNPNADPQQNLREADGRTNEPSSSEHHAPSLMREYQYLVQGETWQKVEANKLEDKIKLTITHEKKLITLDKIWLCEGKLLGQWGDKDGQLKDLCLSFALYRLLRCRFDYYPLPDVSIPKTRRLLFDVILSRDTNQPNGGAEEEQGSVGEQGRVVEEQQEDSRAENKENDVKDEVAERVFRITEAELSFLNDYMYSRLPVIFWREGSYIISMFLCMAVVATTYWVGIAIVRRYTPPKGDFTHVIHGYNIDVIITWSILFFIVFKETWEILIYLFSDWTKVVLISTYVECACMKNCLIENMIWLICKFSMVGRWHGKIDQYSFLEAYKYRPPICNLAYYLSLGSLPKAFAGAKSKSKIALPKEVKKAIVKSICSLKEDLNMGRLPTRMPSLNRNNLSADIFQICEIHELYTCSHTILVWHIATSFCEIELCRHYNIYLADSELPSIWAPLNCCSSKPFLIKQERLEKKIRENFIVANSLSRYCAHLLIHQPDLLPDHPFIAEEVFKRTVKEARIVLEGCDRLQTIYNRLMMEGGKEINPENERTIMRLGAKLGKELIETISDEAARWKALADVWADLLIYMAPSPYVEAHKECLATGGELITHVWVLLSHAGILKNSLAD